MVAACGGKTYAGSFVRQREGASAGRSVRLKRPLVDNGLLKARRNARLYAQKSQTKDLPFLLLARPTIFHIWPSCASLALDKGWQEALFALLRLALFRK